MRSDPSGLLRSKVLSLRRGHRCFWVVALCIICAWAIASAFNALPIAGLVLRHGHPARVVPSSCYRVQIKDLEFIKVPAGYSHVVRHIWDTAPRSQVPWLDRLSCIMRGERFGDPESKPGPGFVDRWVASAEPFWITPNRVDWFDICRLADAEDWEVPSSGLEARRIIGELSRKLSVRLGVDIRPATIDELYYASSSGALGDCGYDLMIGCSLFDEQSPRWVFIGPAWQNYSGTVAEARLRLLRANERALKDMTSALQSGPPGSAYVKCKADPGGVLGRSTYLIALLE